MVFMNFYVVYKKESSHQSSDDEEEVDTYNPAALQPPANQSNSIDNNIIQRSASTPQQPSSPLQEFQTSVSPVPAKRIRTRGGAHICGGRNVSQVPQQPSTPLQEYQTSVSPIPAKRIRTREGAHICGGRGVSQVPQARVESRKRNLQNGTGDSSDDNAEVDDSDNDDKNNADSFEWNDTPRPWRQF